MTRAQLEAAIAAAMADVDPNDPVDHYGDDILPDHLGLDWGEYHDGTIWAEITLTYGGWAPEVSHRLSDRRSILAAFANPAAFAQEAALTVVGIIENLAYARLDEMARQA